MIVQYHPLFRVQLMHEYFRDLKCPNITLVPSDDCRQLLRGAHMLWQKGNSMFTALIRENGLKEPFTNTVTPDGTGSDKYFRSAYGKNIFRFYLQHTNHTFVNYTNMDLPASRNTVFYFSNLSANNRNNFLFLSQKIEDHAAGRVYEPGTMVMEPGKDEVLECIKKHNSTAATLADRTLWTSKGLRFLRKPLAVFTEGKLYQPGDLVLKPLTTTKASENVFESVVRQVAGGVSDLNNNSLWIARGKGQVQYASSADRNEYSAGTYIVPLPAPVTKATINIFAFNFNAAAPAYDLPVQSQSVMNFPAAVSGVPVSFSQLKPGRYRVVVNNVSVFVYYDPQLAQPGMLGVVEIFNHLPASNAWSYLDAAEKFRNLDYVISFPARSVLWKYIPKDSRAKAVVDKGTSGYNFSKLQGGFVSTVPIQLSEDNLETLELSFTGDMFKLQSLPNPMISRLGKCTQHGFDYLCSEIYLNY